MPLRLPLGSSFAYGGMPIEVFDGLLWAMVEFNGKSMHACIFDSTTDTDLIIGRDLVNKLGLTIQGSKGTEGSFSSGVGVCYHVRFYVNEANQNAGSRFSRT